MAVSSSGGASSSAVKAGNAFVEVSAKSNGIERFFANLSKKITGVGKEIAGIGAKVGAGGAAVLAPLALLTDHAVEAGSAVTDMAERLNTSTETVSALGYAASLAGGSLADVEANIGKMRKTIADKAAGGDEFFGGLLNAEVDDQLAAIADRIAAIDNPTEQLAASMEYFGKAGRKMLPFLRDGAEGLARLRAEAGDTGAIWSSEDAAMADRFGDALGKVKVVLGSLAKAIGMVFVSGGVEGLEQFTTEMIGLGQTIRRFIGENKETIKIVGLVAGGLFAAGTAVTALGASFIAFGAIVAGVGTVLGTLATALMFALSPIGMIVVGIAALGAGLAMVYAESESFAALWRDMGMIFGQAWQGIQDAMAAGDLSLALNIAWVGIRAVFDRGIGELEKLWIEFKYFFVDIWEGIRDFGLDVWDALSDAARGSVNLMIKALNWLIDQLNHVIHAINRATEGFLKLINFQNRAKARGYRPIGDVGHVGELEGKSGIDQMLDLAASATRAAKIEADKQAELDKAGSIDPALKAELDKLNGKAADDRKAKEEAAAWEAMNQAFLALELAGTGKLADGILAASETKGAFAANVNTRSFAYGDRTNDIAKHTADTAANSKRTADAVEKLRFEFD